MKIDSKEMHYGLPEKKKYPMPDEAHVLSAIKFFNYTQDNPKDEKILACNIVKRAKELNMKNIHIGDSNNLRKFIDPSESEYQPWFSESADLVNEASFLDVNKDMRRRQIKDAKNFYKTSMKNNKYHILKKFLKISINLTDESMYINGDANRISIFKFDEDKIDMFNMRIVDSSKYKQQVINSLNRFIDELSDELNCKATLDRNYGCYWINIYAPEDVFNESDNNLNNRKMKNLFPEVQKIISKIPKEEHELFYHGDKFKDSPYLVYRDIQYYKSYGAFIDVYSLDDEDTAIIVIASEPSARGKGITDKLVQNAIKYTPNNVHTLYWRCKKENMPSYKLAIRNGFILDKRETIQNEYVLKYKRKIYLNESMDLLSENYKNQTAKKVSKKFNKLYVGSPVSLDDGDYIIKPSGILFVTPYKGIASIFIRDINKINKGFTNKRFSSNLGYDKWYLPHNKLNEPFKEVHINVQTDDDYHNQSFSNSGYIYTIDGTNLDLYYYDWMDPTKEFIVLSDKIPFIEKEAYNVKYLCTKSEPLNESIDLLNEDYRTMDDGELLLLANRYMNHKNRGLRINKLAYEGIMDECRKRGLRPDGNQYQGSSKYRKRGKLSEEKYIETYLTTNPFINEFLLFHGSHSQNKLSKIQPISKNPGTKLSQPRYSSFWTDKYDFAVEFALFKLISEDDNDYTIFYNKENRWLVKKSQYNDIINMLKNKVVYVYSKVFKKEEIGRGHMISNVSSEFSVDFSVVPDTCKCLHFNDYKDILINKLVPKLPDDKEEIKKIKNKEMMKFNNKNNFIYYTLEKDFEISRNMNKYNPNLNESNQQNYSSLFCPETLEDYGNPVSMNRVKSDILNNKATIIKIKDEDIYGNLYITSDLHFYGNMNHTAKTNIGEESHITDVIRSINKSVGEEDTLLILGDIGFKYDEQLKIHTSTHIKRINCKHIWLVTGNHDLLTNEEYEQMGIERICTRMEYRNYIFTHYPIDLSSCPPSFINIHGHIHTEPLSSYMQGAINKNDHINAYYYNHMKPLIINDYLQLNSDLIAEAIGGLAANVMGPYEKPSEVDLKELYPWLDYHLVNFDIGTAELREMGDLVIPDREENLFNESYVLNEENILSNKSAKEYNVELWIEGDRNILFIGGFKDIGNSLGKKISSHYNCDYLSMSDVKNMVCSENPEYIRKLRKDYKRNSNQFYNFTYKYLKDKYKGKKLIIEGAEIMWFGFDNLKTEPIIIQDNNVVEGMFSSISPDSKLGIIHIIKTQLECKKFMDAFIKKMNSYNVFKDIDTVKKMIRAGYVLISDELDLNHSKKLRELYMEKRSNAGDTTDLFFLSYKGMIEYLNDNPDKKEIYTRYCLIPLESIDDELDDTTPVNPKYKSLNLYTPYTLKLKKIEIKNINESIDILNEASFNIDPEGSLIITMREKTDFMAKYNLSHKLIKIYMKSNNEDGVKHELCKLWFMYIVIEKYYINPKKPSNSKKYLELQKEAIKAKAFILNEFYQGLEYLLKKDKNFDFSKYYEESPYYADSIKITTDNIKGFKKIMSAIIH